MVTVEEMKRVVEDYIYKRKGRRVNIELRYHPFIIQQDIDKLHYCYNIALDYKG
jgi:hypothetical protein